MNGKNIFLTQKSEKPNPLQRLFRTAHTSSSGLVTVRDNFWNDSLVLDYSSAIMFKLLSSLYSDLVSFSTFSA